MSFPGSFPSQLTAIMEALLKAVVAEVTALVEDGAVELRLELRDRDRQILDKEREAEERDREIEDRDRVIEDRDRVIEELRAAVEELMARGEEKDRQEQTQNCELQEWTKEEMIFPQEEETEPFVKREPPEEFSTASEDLHESLWAPPLPTATTTSAACEYDESWRGAKHETTPSDSQHSPETDDCYHSGQNALPLDSLLNMNQDTFYSTQPGFTLTPCPSAEERRFNATKQLNYGGYRCDQCGKTFTVKWRLTTHQSVHTGAKPYSCRRCGKRFSRRDNCVRHEKSDARCKDGPGMGLRQTAAVA